eukprot:7204461-Pyramimonas_sp.AAC.1
MLALTGYAAKTQHPVKVVAGAHQEHIAPSRQCGPPQHHRAQEGRGDTVWRCFAAVGGPSERA